MSSSPTLNDYQLAELKKFLEAHAISEEIAAVFDSAIGPVERLEWFPCKVPGTIALANGHGSVMKLLFPTPGPRNNDPLFQHAGPLTKWAQTLNLIKSRVNHLRDWQWGFSDMDAPDEFPAGACEWFDAGDEAYGACQMTTWREGPP